LAKEAQQAQVLASREQKQLWRMDLPRVLDPGKEDEK